MYVRVYICTHMNTHIHHIHFFFLKRERDLRGILVSCHLVSSTMKYSKKVLTRCL